MTRPRSDRSTKARREFARTQAELEKRIFHLRTLYEASREISLVTDSPAIARSLLMMIVGTVGVERGVIVLVDPRDNRVALVSQRGCDEATGAALSKMVAAGVVTKLHACAAVIRRANDPSALLTSLDLRLWIPFSVNDPLIGGLGLGAKLTEEDYSDDDCELLVTLANQAAIAFRNAAAHEQLVRYAEELAATLRRIQLLESMKTNLAKFVPRAVQALIEESPEAPLLDKHEADVSVLFADITGYTRLSAEMELERVNQLVEVYFGAFLDEIVKHGGDVNETAGDGLMVIFQDADPRRHAAAAVRAGLAIQLRTEAVNATLEGFFEPIRMHVAVNSGIAAVGVTKIEGASGTRWTYTASGTTTNLAARLSGLGEAGHVVVSQETRDRLGPEFLADDMGFQTLKNVSQPVRAYRVTATNEAQLLVAVTPERRRHPRRPVAWAAHLWIDDRCVEASVVNSSLYGVFIALPPGGSDLLTLGSSYRLEVLTAGVTFTCSAEVRHVSERGVGMQTSDPCPLT